MTAAQNKAKPSVGDGDQRFLMEAAERNLVRAIRALDAALIEAEGGDGLTLKDVPKVLGDLRKAMQSAMDERKRFDEQKRKQGGLGTHEIDFGAAKSEILNRLARLRGSSDTGSISD